jgi:hypothetical protein
MNRKLVHIFIFFFIFPLNAWVTDQLVADSKIVKAIYIGEVAEDTINKTIEVKIAEATEKLNLGDTTAKQLIAKWHLKTDDRIGLILGDKDANGNIVLKEFKSAE